jgi:flagellar basal body-associated protein FliL
LREVSDTHSPSKTTENTPTEDAELADLAEIDDLEEIDGLNLTFTRSPRLKEYLTSPDSPSRYLMILAILFGILAATCFGLLVTQYLKHRHHAEKETAPVIQTVKIEATFHQPLGQFKIDWDDAELHADLDAECSTKEACEELKAKDTEARDLILPLLQGSSRSQVLNPTQKQYLRQQIAEKLNDLKLNGRVIQVDFSDLQIDPRKN